MPEPLWYGTLMHLGYYCYGDIDRDGPLWHEALMYFGFALMLSVCVIRPAYLSRSAPLLDKSETIPFIKRYPVWVMLTIAIGFALVPIGFFLPNRPGNVFLPLGDNEIEENARIGLRWDLWGLSSDSAGNIHVAEADRLIKIVPGGTVTQLETGAFCIATDGANNAYVVTAGLRTAILKITPGGMVTTLAGRAYHEGAADGTGNEAMFVRPEGVATDAVGNVYVADTGNNAIRKITPRGVVTTLAGKAGEKGKTDGAGTEARFDGPIGVTTDNAGNILVVDYREATIRKISPDGVVSTLWSIPRLMKKPGCTHSSDC